LFRGCVRRFRHPEPREGIVRTPDAFVALRARRFRHPEQREGSRRCDVSRFLACGSE
jgi:hypothetical protein